jgi:serine O-acetyltransferase
MEKVTHTNHSNSLKINDLQRISTQLNSRTRDYEFIPRPVQPLSMPENVKSLMEYLRAVLFPGFFGDECDATTQLQAAYDLLFEQICGVLRFSCETKKCKTKVPVCVADELTSAFVGRLPEVKRLLATDVQAVYEGDPAATSPAEVVICYPAIAAMLHYRAAHELLLLKVPVLPRIITEFAHSATGIDIHPAATIGEYFSIDHGTGVVIGGTAVIGKHVRLYQGVTLGARSFTLDERGMPINTPRHPILEDNVIIYSNSTILGRITIGHDSIIGGNVWLARGVPPHSLIVQHKASNVSFTDGSGI